MWCALNVVNLITGGGGEKKVKKHQQNAHYAEAIILPTTKDANIIVTQLKETTHLEIIHKAHHQ